MKYITGKSHLVYKNHGVSQPNLHIAQKANDWGATHVVIGIIYGARMTLSYEEDITKDLNEFSLKAGLELNADLGIAKLSGKADLNMASKDNEIKMNQEFDYTGDIPGPAKITWNAIEQFLFELQDKIEEIKPCGPDRLERGSIVAYELVPINTLIDMTTKMLHVVAEDTIKQITENFRIFENCLQRVNQIQAWDKRLGRF